MWGSQGMEMYQYKSKEHVNVSWKDMEYNHFEPRKEHTALKFRMNSPTVYLEYTKKLPFSKPPLSKIHIRCLCFWAP